MSSSISPNRRIANGASRECQVFSTSSCHSFDGSAESDVSAVGEDRIPRRIDERRICIEFYWSIDISEDDVASAREDLSKEANRRGVLYQYTVTEQQGVGVLVTESYDSCIENCGPSQIRTSSGSDFRATAEEHYGEHRDKPFFGELVDFITSGPLLAAVIEGREAITSWRTMMGATDPAKAAPGTIRGDLATVMSENVSHGSDSPESAAREIALFFPGLGAS